MIGLLVTRAATGSQETRARIDSSLETAMQIM